MAENVTQFFHWFINPKEEKQQSYDVEQLPAGEKPEEIEISAVEDKTDNEDNKDKDEADTNDGEDTDDKNDIENKKNEEESGISSVEEDLPAYMITDEDTEKEDIDDYDGEKPVIKYNSTTMETVKDTTVLNGISESPPNTPSSVSEMAIFDNEFTDCSPYLVQKDPEDEKSYKCRKLCKRFCCVLLFLLALLILLAVALYLVIFFFSMKDNGVLIPIYTTTEKGPLSVGPSGTMLPSASTRPTGITLSSAQPTDTMISIGTSTSMAQSSTEQTSTETPPQCPPYQFACTNGECIYSFEACNGEDDCGDNSDEHEKCGGIKDTPPPSTNSTPYPTPITGPCKSYEFECDNGECFYFFSECDGVQDCADGSDEICAGCANDEFQCGNGTCISSEFVCDGTENCNDASDEANCTTGCANDEFQCGNGTCISSEFVCDGTENCNDASDEANCTIGCANGEFQCGNGTCILSEFVCDGTENCNDGSDETNCTTGCANDEFECGNGTCISSEFVCDGTENCNDASDEANCTIACAPDEVTCASGECIPPNGSCDGYPQCSLNAQSEDELGCTYDCVIYNEITQITCSLPYDSTSFPNFISRGIMGYETAASAELNLRQLYYTGRSCDRKALTFMCGVIFPMCPAEGERNIAVCKSLCEYISTKPACVDHFTEVNLNVTQLCDSLPEVPHDGSTDFCTFY